MIYQQGYPAKNQAISKIREKKLFKYQIGLTFD